MDREKFLEQLSEILDSEETISFDTVLLDIEEWDSLSRVSFMAMANVRCGKLLKPQTVKEAKTVADLYSLLQ